jgi:hypothetical protein
MAFSNRIKVNATGIIDTMALGVPVNSFIAFPDGETPYTILADDDTWQIGLGTVVGFVLTIDTVEQNSSGTVAKLDFTGKNLQIAEVITGALMNQILSDIAALQGIQPPDTISFPNVNATDLFDLAHFYDHAWSAGLTNGGIVTDNGSCTVNISEADVVFRTGIDDHDALVAYHIPATTAFVIGAGQAGTIYADYNAGIPAYGILSPGGPKLNLRTQIPIAAVLCDGTNVIVLTLSKYNTDPIALYVRRLIDLGLAHVPGGTILGESGIQNISITAGLFYYGVQPIPNLTFDSSVTDTFTYWYSDGAGGWNSIVTQSQISITQYDDGSGILANLGNNNYGQSWVYVNGSDAGFETHVIFGTENDSNLGNVEPTSPPTTLPPILDFLGVLVGRVIIQESFPAFVKVESAFATEYKPGSVVAHNSLAGLQGGAFDDYYHVTFADLQYFATIPSLFDGKVSNDASETGANSVVNCVFMTQVAYDALTPIPTTLYIING